MKKSLQKKKDNYAQEAIALHARLRGKLEMAGKVRVKNYRDLSLCYTPGVGAVSLAIAKNKKKAWRLTGKGNTVAIVSDGSAVLGLGKIGPEAALPVMEGKAMLFKQFADINAVPLVLATYDPDAIVEAIKAIAPGFGGINLEDISAPRCFYIEERLKKELDIPVMHDDQHGTAVAVLAALINALKVVGKRMESARIVISGCGAAGSAVAYLLRLYGAAHIIVVDRNGIIHSGRDDLNEYKAALARVINAECVSAGPESLFACRVGGLADAMRGADAFIGVSAPGVVEVEMVKTMAKKAIVFALANPVPEITPEKAYKGGAAVIATGRSDFPNQINNALVFPGIFRGVLDWNLRAITDEMKIRAAESLARTVKRPRRDRIVPSLFDKKVVRAIAAAVRRV